MTAILAIIISMISVVVTGIIGFLTLNHAKRDRNDRKAAEAEIAAIKKRAIAPYFRRTQKIIDPLYIHQNGGIGRVGQRSGYLLAPMCPEVKDLDKGAPVFLVVENIGDQLAIIRGVKLDGEEITFDTEPQFESSHDQSYFRYEFDPEKFGKKQRLEVRFLSAGIEAVDVYEIVHGHAIIEKVDAPS